MTKTNYNGWKNYETWNISLWIGNDEGLYSIAKESVDYPDFVLKLKELGVEQTPDDVFYAMRGVDLDALNEVVQEIK